MATNLESEVKKMFRLIFFLGVLIASIYLFFFKQFNSDFTFIFGDKYDAVIEAVLVSHWYHVLLFSQIWNQPLYFFPHQDVLGYNDAYFIYGIIASIYRVLGYNLLISQELTHITVKAIGFISMVLLLKRINHGHYLINIISSMLFTLFISSTNQAYHGQLFAVAFAPFLTILLIGLVQAIKSASKKQVYLYGFSLAILYDALLLTGFYMAWFYGLCLIIFFVACAVVNFDELRLIIRSAASCKMALISIVLVFMCFVIPFLIVYLPKLQETGGQNYADQIFYSLHFADVVNYGPGSIVWGKLFSLIRDAHPGLWRPGEYQVGFTPDVIIVLILAITAILMSLQVRVAGWHKALALTVLIGMILPISVAAHSLWFFVDSIIPGAHGLRVIARLYIFIAFPATLLIALYFSALSDKFPRIRILLTLLLTFMCVSQINLLPPVNLTVSNEISLVSSAVFPPQYCKSFFVVHPVGEASPADKPLLRNVQAMLLADYFELPTLDGQATFIPHNLNFDQRNHSLYNMHQYIVNNKLDNVCKYNITSRKWSSGSDINFYSEIPHYMIGTPLVFSTAGNGYTVATSGWSAPEPWGTWTDANSASLMLRLAIVSETPMKLDFFAHAFLVPVHPKLAVIASVNGKVLKHFYFTYPDGTSDAMHSVTIPAAVVAASNGVLNIKFSIDKPVSPASVGLSPDPRKLGLGMVWLKVSTVK